MSNSKFFIKPVILAGGSGKRLWPTSRKKLPKQFIKLIGEETLFQQAVGRVNADKFPIYEKAMVLAHHDYRFIAREQLNELRDCEHLIVLEPCSKNTAASILAACLLTEKDSNKDKLILTLPADHLIMDDNEFNSMVERAAEIALTGNFVCFGVRPTGPNTAYGYLKTDKKNVSAGARKVIKFHEKPDLNTAKEMIGSGDCFWNSGMFLFQAQQLISVMKKKYPEQLQLVARAIEAMEKDLDFLCLDQESWEGLEELSVDHAVMEHIDNLIMLPLQTKWADLGSWTAVQEECAADTDGNSLIGDAFAMHCHNSLLRSESDRIKLVGVGLQNIIAVATDDAVLVLDKKHDQQLKLLVEHLEHNNTPQATDFKKVYRPWGYFESLSKAEGFQVKRIVVNVGGKLSLQSHFHRSEHWVISTGTAVIVLDDKVITKSVGESVFIPLGAKHSLENQGKVPLTIIEVQIGSYLEEDDIVRYSDIYNRI